MAGLESQLKKLEAAHCKKKFQGQVSSVAVRVQLDAAIEFALEGDVLVTTKLDWLARGSHGNYSGIGEKAVGLRTVNLGMDAQTSTGKLMLTVFRCAAQFEPEGVAKTKIAGKYKGRKPLADNLRQEVMFVSLPKVWQKLILPAN